MNGGIVLTVLAMTALWPPWPFGRDDKAPEPTGTIKDLESEEVAIDTSAAIVGSESKAMESYRLFLDLASDDPLLQAEATRRLADLQLESEEAAELARNVESLGANMGSTIGLYEQLLSSYPNYAKNDLVLYQLARAYEAGGEVEQALVTLDRLVAEFPDTPHADEAHFRRGETLFIEQRYGEAEEAYERVLESGESSTFGPQSLYKLGWSLFKQTRHDESLAPFFGLLDQRFGGDADTSDPAAVYTAMGRAEQELVEDTFRVLSISFSYLDGPEAVTEYFEDNGMRNYAYIVYTNLGDLYLDQERYQDAADAYEAFVALDAYHAKAPLMQVEVIEAFKQGGFTDLVLDGKRGFVERYGPDSPYWTRYGYEEQPEVVAHLKSNLTDLAAFHHANAQNDGGQAEYAAAARWYRSYLQSFPDDADAPQTNFLLSEVLFESGDYAEAALEYERTAYAYPYHARSAEAGYAALLAYAEHEQRMQGEARATWHAQGIDSALRFATTYTEHPQAAAVQTDAAEKLFAQNDFTRAREVARAVVVRPSLDAELGRTAWTVVAHSEFDLGDFAAAEAAYVELSARIPPPDPQREEIVERIASSIYKQGELAQAGGDTHAAVDHFLRVGRAAPSSPIRATAEYDAAAALIQLGDWPRATNVLENFRAAFPDHELASDVTASLAVAYVETGDSVLAAAEFERIADGDGSEDVRKEALWRAAELYRDSGQDGAAATTFGRYIERHPRPVAPAVEARQHLADLADARGERAERMRWLDDIVAADAGAGAERTDRTRYLAAKASLVLAEPARNAFRAARLVAPLADSLSIKRERMEAALEAYGKAADYGVAEVTTAATFELAELYHGLSRDLFESERPAELTAAELGQYDVLLEEQAYPFEEQAIELHEVNAARTPDGLYDEWVAKSLTALAELVPVRYAKQEMGEQFVSAIR